tara:strand:+ start:3840 stop:5945 length:2106 start_codon:yes stop_codon:yes gene_type:complete
MAYPTAQDLRVQYWQGQIGFVQKKVKPLFEACNILVNQFYNEASTEREQDAGDAEEEHVRRVKSGLIHGFIDQSLANMLDRAPTFQCYPETREAAQRIDPMDPQGATLASGVAKISNYRYRETNQLRVDERCALDAFLFPYGVAKIGFELDVDAVEQEMLQDMTVLDMEDPAEENVFIKGGIPVRVQDAQDHLFHIQVHQNELRMLLEESDNEEVKSFMKESFMDHIKLHKLFNDRPAPSANTNVHRGSPYAVRWQPDLFLTDAFSLDGPMDARWIAFGWELPIDEVRANPAYRNVDDLEPSRYKDAPDKEGDLESDGFDVVRGWEVWARNFPAGKNKFRNLFFTIAEGNEKFLQYEEEWPYDRIDNYPVETLTFQTGVRQWFHKPPLLMAGGDTVQALTNEIMDSFLYTIRKQKNIWLVDPAAGIDRDILQDILDAPDGSIVEVPGLGEQGSNVIMPLPFLSVPSDKGGMLNLLQQMFDRSAGTPQPVRMPATETATEASIIEKKNTSRENRRSALLSEFQVRKARKMFQLDSQFRPEKLFLLDKNANQFISLSKELSEGEYLFTMDVSSQSTALAVERSQWMDLLNLFAGLTPLLTQTYGVPPNIPELARRLLVRGFNEKDVEDILPMLEKQAQTMQAQAATTQGEGGTSQFANPEAQALQEALQNGRAANAGVGPLDADSFNRDLPSEGQQAGETVTV